MLIEQIFAYKLDPTGETLKKIRYWRLWRLAKALHNYATIKDIAYISKINFDTYIQSTLQSIKLASIYLFGNDNEKKEIIKYINKVSSGDLIVDDMLYYFGANLEEVSNDLKTLKKVK
jgi:hypothetical protein